MPVSRTPIGDQLAALYPDRSDKRRAGHKAAALAERLGTRTFQVSGCVGGRTVTVANVRAAGGMLSCTITHPDLPSHYPDGVPVQPFEFHNPPIMVADPANPVTVSGPDGRGTPRQVPGGKEDPVEAARQMVRGAFASALARFG